MESVLSIKGHSRRRRSKKPKAYIIGGHGSEREGQNDETFIVPPGCFIVVKAVSGCATDAYSSLEVGLCSLTPTILKNPIAHYNDLERILGPLAIYKPGDTCPQFHYSLLQCYQMSDIYWTGCNSFGSGVMDVDSIYTDNDFLQRIRNVEPYNRRLKNNEALSELDRFNSFNHDSIYDSIYPYLSKLYQHSVFPNPQDIEIIVHNAIDEGINTMNTMLEYIGEEVSTTQEELCSLFPGVYYHTICRATPTGIRLFHSSVNEADKVPSHITYVSSNSHVRKLLGEHIGEAEAHRKPHIRNMYATRYATSANVIADVKQGPSRSTLRRRHQRRRQKQRQRTNKK